MPSKLILASLPQRLAYEIGGAIYFLKVGAGKAFFKGKLDALRRLPAVLRKRKGIQIRKTVTNDQLRSIMENGWFQPKWRKLLSVWRSYPVAPEAKRP